MIFDKKQEHLLFQILLILFVATAFFLRFFEYFSWSLSNDELSGLRRALYDNIHDVIYKGVMQEDTHPAGLQFFIHFWIKLVGSSEWALRLPFVISGCFSVWFSYLISKKIFGNKAAIMTACIFSVSSFFILYSQLARPYAFGLLFTLCTTFLLIQFHAGFGKKKYILPLLSISIALTAYFHYFALLTTIFACLFFLFIAEKKNIKYLLVVYITSSILFLPHLKITLNQFQNGFDNVSWIPSPMWYWFFDFFHHAFNYSFLLILTIFLIIIFSVTKIRYRISLNRFHIFCLFVFVSTYITGHIFSIIKTPLLQPSIMLFAFPFIVFTISSFAEKFTSRIFSFFILLLFITGLIGHLRNGKIYKKDLGNFKNLAGIIYENNKLLGGKDSCFIVANINSPFYLNYYFEKDFEPILCDNYRIWGDTGLLKLKKNIENSVKPYAILAEMGSFNYNETQHILKNYYPYLFEKIQKDENTIYIFSKNKSFNTEIPDNTAYSVLYGFENNNSQPQLPIDSSQFYKGKSSLSVDEKTEFAPGFIFELDSLLKFEKNEIEIDIECYAKTEMTDTKAVLVCQQTDCDDTWKGADFKYFVKESQWFRVGLTFQVETKKCKSKKIVIYCWNPGKEKLFIDEINIKIRKKNVYKNME